MVDVHSYEAAKTRPPMLYNVKFDPGASKGINSGMRQTSSYLRTAFQGTKPKFLQSDWSVAKSTK